MNRRPGSSIAPLLLLCSLTVQAGDLDLGGPCLEQDATVRPGIHAELRRAAATGDFERMIDLHKVYLREDCSNPYRWLGLAEAYLDAGDSALAIAALRGAHDNGFEIKPQGFEYRERLLAFVETETFRDSGLGRELHTLRETAQRRKGPFRRRLDALPAAALPPERYVAEGACPFECCTYREWPVLEDTDLYEKPFGGKVAGSVTKGERVRGITGDVHLRPAPVVVIHDHPPFSKGDLFFLLDYAGEGIYRYWRDGEVAEDDIWVDEICLRPSSDCWAEFVEPAEEREEPVWWILIETGDGRRGWTDRPRSFGDKDACG